MLGFVTMSILFVGAFGSIAALTLRAFKGDV